MSLPSMAESSRTHVTHSFPLNSTAKNINISMEILSGSKETMNLDLENNLDS